MSELPIQTSAPATDVFFFRPVTGTRVHLPQCPHLVGGDALVAGPAERLKLPVCNWSQAQLGGYGREHFATLEDVFRRVGLPVEAQAAVREALRFVQYDEIFAVNSLTYGALGLRSRTVAGFGKTYYWVGGRRVNLPSYSDSTRAGNTSAGAYGATCPVHFLTMNLAGVCDDC